MQTSGSPTPPSITYHDRGDGTVSASAYINGIHLAIWPILGGGYKVNFYGDDGTEGPITSRDLNSLAVGEKPYDRGDLEEMAYTYATRLAAGIPVENMFRDIEDSNREFFKHLWEEMRNK